MSTVPHFLIRNSLHRVSAVEWYVDVPVGRKEQRSSVFVLQGRKMFFHFFKCYSNRFVLSLRHEGSYKEKLRPFSVSIFAHLLDESDNRFKVCYLKVIETPVENIWSSDPYEKSTSDIIHKLMGFTFLFDKDCGLTFQESEARTKYGLIEDVSTALQNNLENLSVDLGNMLETSAYADVQIQCNGGVVHAHRAILASRSKVFDRMFQADLQESRPGIIEIMVDAELAAVKLFLQFIYSGNIGNPSVDMVYCVYRLADKYEVSNLKDLCSYLMAEHACKKGS